MHYFRRMLPLAIAGIATVSTFGCTGESSQSAQPKQFTESDFYWDETTRPFKGTIMAGVQKLSEENDTCKSIDPSSAYISSSKGTDQDPVFYVTCGGDSPVNVFFSQSEVEQDSPLAKASHIDQGEALRQCQAEAKAKADNPKTVDFSVVVDLAITEHANGRTTVNSSFTAENDLGIEKKFSIRCLTSAAGLFEATINPVN